MLFNQAKAHKELIKCVMELKQHEGLLLKDLLQQHFLTLALNCNEQHSHYEENKQACYA